MKRVPAGQNRQIFSQYTIFPVCILLKTTAENMSPHEAFFADLDQRGWCVMPSSLALVVCDFTHVTIQTINITVASRLNIIHPHPIHGQLDVSVKGFGEHFISTGKFACLCFEI